MKRLIAPILVLGLLAAACGARGAQSIGPVPSGSPSETPSATPSTEPTGTPTANPPGQTVTLEVWFAFMPGGSQSISIGPSLFVTHRTVPFTVGVARAALTELLRGPSTEEGVAGISTGIPRGTELLGVSIENGTATVDLSGAYASGGGSATMFMRLAQVVYTLTQFPSVHGVLFKVDGKPVTTFSSEGIVLEGPQTRKDYRDQLPPILVETPSIGERVSSPVTVSGSADVFEAVVSIRILDANGKVITAAFTMATCGTGCRGTYEKAVRYSVDHTQPGVIEVFEASAKDGSPQFIVTIPVTLTA